MHVIIFLLSLFIDFIHPYFLEELSLEVVVCFDGCRKRTLEVLCCWFSRQEDYLAKNKSYHITHVQSISETGGQLGSCFALKVPGHLFLNERGTREWQ